MIARIRRWSERRRRAKRKPRPVTYRFHDPCFGPTRGALPLPAGVKKAAEALEGKRMTLAEAIGRLQQAISTHGGFLEVPERHRAILWHMPADGRGRSQVHHLIRLK